MSASLTDFSEDKVSSDAFYQKLLQLKEAHKKTLQMYEQLYTEQKKADAPCNNTSGEITRSQLASLENLLSADVHSAGGVSDSWREVDQSRVIQPSVTKDSVKDLSASKPPSGRPLASEGIPMRSSAVKTYTGTEVGSDAGSYRHQSSLSGDVAEYETSDDEQHKENTDNVSSQSFIDTRQSAMARIGDMWERFSVDNYCPRSSEVRTKPGMFRSNSMSRISLSAREPRRSSTIDRGGSAKKRVTVPKPFSMSMREANQTPRKSRAAIELEQREEERRYAEELECQKKFKAMPLPAHIHFRLYDELNEERESRRRFIVQHRQELLNTMQKPFQFTSREEEKKKAKADSKATGLQQRGRPHFRAHPFPSRIFDDSVVDKMREEDEYRKIRMKVRAKDLLRSSSLPPTMRLRGKDYTDGRERQKLFAERAKKAGITIEHKFRPKINHTIPDFDKQYDKFMQDLAEAKKYQREATVCRPFNLRTSTGRLNNRANRKSSMDEFSEADDSFNHNMPFSKSYTGNLSTSGTFAGMYTAPSDVIPWKTTAATEVRSSANKLRIQKKMEKEQVEREKMERQLHGVSKNLKKAVHERSPQINQTTVHNEIMEKLKSRRLEDHRRVKDYKRQLNEMNQRVKQRPLLFEQVAQKNAEKAAERRYRETLGKSGLDVEFLGRHSGGGSVAAASSVLAADEAEHSPRDTAVSRRSSVRASPSRFSAGSRSPDDRRSPGGGSASQRSRTASRGGNYTDDYDNDDDNQSNISEEIREDEEA